MGAVAHVREKARIIVGLVLAAKAENNLAVGQTNQHSVGGVWFVNTILFVGQLERNRVM